MTERAVFSRAVLHTLVMRVLQQIKTAYRVWGDRGLTGIATELRRKLEPETGPYELWIAENDTLPWSDRRKISARTRQMKHKPLISVVMPVYNVAEVWLRRAIESVRSQLYPHWELCVADDNSPSPHVRAVLEEYARKDSRIKVVFRRENGHISVASNSALELATGEYIALLDHDDELAAHALYMVAEEINAYPEADLIYSDEDKITEEGKRYEPYFKTDWNPDLFYSQNFVSHLGVYRASIVKKIGGFRPGYEGSQDYDLVLRVVEQIPESHIRHIPHVLYHWRAIPGSVILGGKDYAHEAARRAIQSHLRRKGSHAEVIAAHYNFHRVVYPIQEDAPLVSLIIGTRDGVDLLRQALDGILNRTDYSPLEVIIIDNGSSDERTLAYLRELAQDERVRVVRYDAPFNFSAINNLGVSLARGEVIGLINNDIDVISPGWLREMVSHALRREIGAVGAKLYYVDDRIQHAGILLGYSGVALHAHKFFDKKSGGYASRAQLIQNYSAVTGACLVMRREVFEEVGGLDEVNLAVAYNDIDLCLRVREKGYRVLWTPYAELYYLESATRGSDATPENLPRLSREADYMKVRWGALLHDDPFYTPNLALNAGDFSLAHPSRAVKPWKQQAKRWFKLSSLRGSNLTRRKDEPLLGVVPTETKDK